MLNIPGYIGRRSIATLDHVLNLVAFAYRLVVLLVRRPKSGRAMLYRVIIEQVYFTAVQALTIIIPIALIVGGMLIIQFTRLSGQIDLGKMVVLLIVRELGPVITALVVILRSATAVTIEIGYMNALNEVEALELSGIDPMRILCLPRLVGITTAILCLFIVFDLVAILGGCGIVWVMTHMQLGNFLGQIGKAVTAVDIAVGIIKALCFGLLITVVSLYHGFTPNRRITDVPIAASRSAVECFFYSLIVNIVISVIFYL